MNNELDTLLKFDPLAEAEKITGQNYKEDKLTESLGFFAMLENNQRKKEILKEIKDTHYGMVFNDIFTILEEEGFERLYSKTNTQEKENGDIEETTQYYYWNYNDKVFVHFENYGDSLNSGSMHYCLKVEDFKQLSNITSSGGWNSKTNTWNGDHDIRQAFRYNLNKLRSKCQLVDWTEEHFLYLVSYMENKEPNYDYEAITNKVLAEFPSEVLKSMGIVDEFKLKVLANMEN